MLWRFRRRYHRRNTVLTKVVIIALVLAVLITVWFESAVNNIQTNIIENKARVLAEKSVNSAVSDYISNSGSKYGDFITLNYGDSGNIETITANSMAINAFKSEVDMMIQEELEKLHVASIKVPLGAFVGLTMFSATGPDVEFTYYLTASFKSKINSYFESAGINQTIHHIELAVEALVTVTCFGHDDQIPFTTNFEIAETIIAGDVPETYIKGINEVDFS